MKFTPTSILIVLCLIVFSGCRYDVAFDPLDAIEIDKSLLGTWELHSQDKDRDNITLLVHRGDQDEYAITYIENNEALLFRGYLVDIEGVIIMNLEWLNGGSEGLKYMFYRYSIEGEKLFLNGINEEIIDEGITSEDEFQRLVEENINNPLLFKKSDDPSAYFVKTNKDS